jgi:hypothetical protein
MKRRAAFLGLFLALLLLAVARWIVDGVLWAVTPQRRVARGPRPAVTGAPRPATAE